MLAGISCMFFALAQAEPESFRPLQLPALPQGPAPVLPMQEPPAAASPRAHDPLMELLQQRGLLAEAAGSQLVQQVRDRASEMVIGAMHFLGVPYLRGGNTEEGLDCSGFTRLMFEKSLGLVLPRRADEQARSRLLDQVRREELKPGDLVFFNTMRRAFSHVGIYIGDGKFIHAPRTGAQVRIEDMRTAYWSKRYNGARRASSLKDTSSD